MNWTNENAECSINRMKERASCRSYEDREIPEDILKNIIEVGLQAATGGNLQPYSIIVVKDPEKKRRLAELNCDQGFMAEAPVNLVFVLDWYRNSQLAKLQNAPYTAYKSTKHFLIGLEDVICAAQSIETAAWFKGIGSCYIGTCMYDGLAHVDLLGLPEHTFPVVILTLGYPKSNMKVRPRLPYEATVFSESYRVMNDSEILDAFGKKFGSLERTLSAVPAVREELLHTMRYNLRSTFSEEETDHILNEISEKNSYGEYMYRFGLHYGASEMLEASASVLRQLEKQRLTPYEKKPTE